MEREVLRLAFADWAARGAALLSLDLRLFRDESVRKVMGRLRRPAEALATAEQAVGHILGLRDDDVDALVASVAVEGAEGDGEACWEKALGRLRERWFKSELQDISRKITQAEVAGERDTVRALLEEKKLLLTEHH